MAIPTPNAFRLWAGLIAGLVLVSALSIVLLIGWATFIKQAYYYARTAREGPRLEKRLKTHSPLSKEAIVVLTGDRGRIPAAINLLRKRSSQWLILSGVHEGSPLVDVINQQVGSSYQIHELWKHIVVESKSQSTEENARETTSILRDKDITSIVLVTSDYHMPRAVRHFRRLNPTLSIAEFPVESDFSEMLLTDRRFTLAGLWKVTIESLKYLKLSLSP